jgi:cytochrome c553
LGAVRQNRTAASSSVWDGVFSAEQAERGWQAFAENCSSCHGAELQGTAEAKTLKGDRFWTDWKETTVDYLLERISKSMPFSEDGTLAGTLPEQTYADIVAYIFNSNGFPAGKSELTRDSSLGVQIIRKEGPGELPATTLAQVVGCLSRATNGTWRLTNATALYVSVEYCSECNTAVSAVNSREFELKFV